MRSTYAENDVTLLLKDITGLVAPQSTEEREREIQAGRHYCEMLPIEYVPTEKYMEAYDAALENYASVTAHAVMELADKVIKARGKSVVLVSLARAGIPIGILLKHFLQIKYSIDVPHYSISIIRGRGIDDNAMKYIIERHDKKDILFVDGWIGKGAITRELEKDIEAYPGVSSELAVLSDPAHITKLFGTNEDFLIPSSCLNCTVSGLISRTFLRDDIIGPDDFHGAVYYGELKDADLSYQFIDSVEKFFDADYVAESEKRDCSCDYEKNNETECCISGVEAENETENETENKTENEKENGDSESLTGLEETKRVAAHYGIDNINLVKPGIGEATRVLLRRVPWRLLISDKHKDAPELRHLIRLANEKGVTIEEYPLVNYKACGIIKKMADA